MEDKNDYIAEQALVVLQEEKEFMQIAQKVISQAQFNILTGKTPPEYIKKRPGKGNRVWQYVPQAYVVQVLNKAFGLDWDFVIEDQNGEKFKVMQPDKDWGRPGSIISHGSLVVRIRNPETNEVLATITKSSSGEKEFVKGMTWGNLIKAAESDAFKKAASRLGVALDLYWDDPAEEMMATKAAFDKMVSDMEGYTGDHTPVAVSQYLQTKGNDCDVSDAIEVIKHIQGE